MSTIFAITLATFLSTTTRGHQNPSVSEQIAAGKYEALNLWEPPLVLDYMGEFPKIGVVRNQPRVRRRGWPFEDA
jgi:hypothetical protein